MPAITTNDLKNGITLELDGVLFTVVEFQHVKPGKGGAFVRSKIRNLRTGAVIDRTFNAGVRVEQAILERKDMQFLYRDGDEYVFMDLESYDQQNVSPIALGDAADYMVENSVAIIAFYNGEIVTVEIPAAVELAVWDCYARQQGVPLRELLGGHRTEIGVGASLGMIQGPTGVADTVEVVRRLGTSAAGKSGRAAEAAQSASAPTAS